MRYRAVSFALLAVMLAVSYAGSAYSQGRTEEDTLVLGDPTVASRGQWRIGGSLEYWHVSGNVKLFGGIVDADVTFSQPGFSLFAANGDWTLQATRRKGEGDVTFNAFPILGMDVTMTGPTEQTDQEFLLRYMFRSVSSHFFPYILLGYTSTELRQEYNVVNPVGVVIRDCDGTPNRFTEQTEYKGPLLGLGGIFPLTRALGVRADVRVVRYSASRRPGAFCHNTVEGEGTGGAFNLTGYYHFGAGFNFQMGMKYSYLNGGVGYDGAKQQDVGNLRRLGYFGMLGYSYDF